MSSMPQMQDVHTRNAGMSDDVDYQILGTEIQFVEIELDPGESAVAEAGAMVYKHPDIQMDTVFGDGSHSDETGGWFNKLAGAGKRLMTGENMFTTVFSHQGQNKARVAFSAPYPGHIIPIKLDQVDGKLICQKDAFLCAAKGVSLGIAFQRNIMTGIFGGEGFVMQSLEGDGWAFIHVGGTVVCHDLGHGEVLHVDTGCLAAMTADVDFNIERVGSIKSMFLGGEGIYFARLQGPGRVWIQSLPFAKLAGRIMAAGKAAGNSDD